MQSQFARSLDQFPRSHNNGNLNETTSCIVDPRAYLMVMLIITVPGSNTNEDKDFFIIVELNPISPDWFYSLCMRKKRGRY